MRKVFYSFHYDRDVYRVQQIRNMGIFDGNRPVSPNDWEEIKRRGNLSIQNWINSEIQQCECLVVLIGQETASREWVLYEIEQAYKQRKGLLGIYIHRLKDPRYGYSMQGGNPFAIFYDSRNNQNLSFNVQLYNPNYDDAYNDIRLNLPQLVEDAIAYNYRLWNRRF